MKGAREGLTMSLGRVIIQSPCSPAFLCLHALVPGSLGKSGAGGLGAQTAVSAACPLARQFPSAYYWPGVLLFDEPELLSLFWNLGRKHPLNIDTVKKLF